VAEVPGLLPARLPDGRDPEEELPKALGAWLGLPPEAVYPTLGASHANFLAYLAFARGARVAAETPAYEAFHRLGAAVGAEVHPFRRDPSRGWRVDPADLARAAVPGTRLLAVTDLHNPTGARLHPEDLDLLVSTARRLDALVLVDEVYLDLDPADRPTSARADPRVLVTNSLTKSHGLWDLRAGWIAGDPACPRLAMLPLSQVIAWLPHARARLATVRRRCAELTRVVDAWVRSRDDVSWVRPDAGFTGFVRVGRPGAPLDGDEVAARAVTLGGTRVIPGSFFQHRDWIRLSYYLEDDLLRRALEGLGRALDSLRGS
jgi:aspartate/methionine/tyrosine aminotransferase